MLAAIPYWIHLIAAAIWIGSQVMMFAVMMPAVRTIDDMAIRRGVLQAVTRRFGYLGWGALLLLLLTGLSNLVDKDDVYAPVGVFDYDYRYAWILTIKLALVVVVILLTAWHTFIHGPRLMETQRLASAGNAPAELQWKTKAMRQTSMIVSVVNLLAVAVIVYLVTLLQNFDYAFQLV